MDIKTLEMMSIDLAQKADATHRLVDKAIGCGLKNVSFTLLRLSRKYIETLQAANRLLVLSAIIRNEILDEIAEEDNGMSIKLNLN